MSQFDRIAVPQGRPAPLLELDIAVSAGATAQIAPPPSESINLMGTAEFCRPRS